MPDNILVYLAVRADQRGKGLGRRLITEILEQTEGDIALHVEADNPARRLYEREGFTTPYLEMRWKRSWPS
jgi:[ribosomal protein S18]-alanine N-acetyltransferase